MIDELLLLQPYRGRDTHPRDIDRALANDFSTEPNKRHLQKQGVAHIHLQQLIDTDRDPGVWPASATYVAWLHEEFYSRLPPEMLFVVDSTTGERLEVVPGEWRRCDVQVGRHLPLSMTSSRGLWHGSIPPTGRPR